MKIERVFAMPNKWTFTMKPIQELLSRYVTDPTEWIDPMAGMLSPAGITNDLDPELETTYKMDALDFLKQLEARYNAIFDPPYSYEKAARLYKQKYPDTQAFYNYIRSCKRELCRIIKTGGYVILFGWTSTGLGMKNGFEMVEALYIYHGWNKINTIVTVEMKVQDVLVGPETGLHYEDWRDTEVNSKDEE